MFFSHRPGAQRSVVPQRGAGVGPGPNCVYRKRCLYAYYMLVGKVLFLVSSTGGGGLMGLLYGAGNSTVSLSICNFG